MPLGKIIWSEIAQTQKDTYCMLTLIYFEVNAQYTQWLYMGHVMNLFFLFVCLITDKSIMREKKGKSN